MNIKGEKREGNEDLRISIFGGSIFSIFLQFSELFHLLYALLQLRLVTKIISPVCPYRLLPSLALQCLAHPRTNPLYFPLVHRPLLPAAEFLPAKGLPPVRHLFLELPEFGEVDEFGEDTEVFFVGERVEEGDVM